MCGRFTLRTPAAAWLQEFLPLWSEDELSRLAGEHAIAARYNIAPTQSIGVIRASADETSGPGFSMLRWGLVPFWASDINIGSRMINARAETIHEKRSFKSAFQKRRCLIPADGYFEWQSTADGKQPYLIEHRAGKMLAMAGVWESNRKLGRAPGEALESCTIVTTRSNQTTQAVHDRMPVFLDEDDRQVWLCPKTGHEHLSELLRPAEESLLKLTPVSRAVGNPRNEGPECVEPVEIQPSDEGKLF